MTELEDHETIHALLESTFSTSPAWRGLIRYNHSADCCLCFFPVDNTARPDPATDQLRVSMVTAISKQPHVWRRVPFSWPRLLDRLKARSAISTSLRLSEVLSEAAKCGVEADHLQREVEEALRLFNELGLVMHHPEPALRDLVVFDPAAFLVEPASRVVCEHGLHWVPQHAAAAAELPDEHRTLRKEGRLSRGLLAALWRDRAQDMPQLERLMVRYGLMLPVSGHLQGEGGTEPRTYIVPALLPRSKESTLLQLKSVCRRGADGAEGGVAVLAARALILFGFAEQLGDRGAWQRCGWATAKEAARDGFLPGGLFAQVRY